MRQQRDTRYRTTGTRAKPITKKKKRRHNEKIFLRIIVIILAAALIAVAVFGISKLLEAVSDMAGDDVTVTTVTVSNKGKIKQTIVEEFNPGFYDEESLRKDIEEKIKNFEGVESDGLEFENGVAKLKLKYDSDDAVAAFNEEIFYADTIDALTEQGVTFNAEALTAGGERAVIVSEAMDIRCPQKILYADGAITVDPDNEKLAHCNTQAGEIAFVIY
ncbi:MAG: hypothetical protein K6G03_05955 [Lachnospiraceae bacterium]|nr:hypothetical protein [Lachnospiraceae bacterium]